MEEIKILKQQIAELQAWKKSLEMSHSIPLNIHQAFKANLVGDSLTSNGTGSATTQEISLTGNAQTINVPAQPTGTLKVSVGNTEYELLYK